MYRYIRLIILFFALGITTSLIATNIPGLAQEPYQEEVNVYVDEVKMFSTSQPTRIVIGKPQIADVTEATDTEITLAGRSAGSTTFVYWDAQGEHSYLINVFAEDMIGVKKRIDSILKEIDVPHVYTKAVDSEGKVMLLGRVKNTQERERVLIALAGLTSKILDLIEVKEEETTIEIDVQVLELNKDATSTLGFTWPGGTSTLTEPTSFSKKLAGIPDSFFRISQWTHPALTAQVDFLVQQGKARVLSRPRIACQSGKEAELIVGGEKPILTTTVTEGGGSGTDVEYKEYGIKLNIKPEIADEERIKLALLIEVSDVGEAVVLGSSTEPTALAYPLSKRSATTELFMSDGKTLAIGGLIKEKTEEDLRKTPGLGDIPILGWFFRKKESKVGGGYGELGDTELFITLTPAILKEKEIEEPAKKEITKLIPPEPIARKIASVVEPSSSDIQNYVRSVKSRISKQVYYPREARDAGWEGILKLGILISSDGNLKEVSVVRSSGYKILDDAGQRAVKKAAPFTPIPEPLKLRQLRIEIPIVYNKN